MGSAIEARYHRPPPAGASGFSLLELTVVVAILATMSVGAMLLSGGKRGLNDMERFETHFQTQRALAISGRDRRGLQIDAQGMQQMLWRNEGWISAGSVATWHQQATFSSAAHGSFDGPEIIFGFDGQTTAFSLTFAGAGSCASDGWTGVLCDTK